MEPFITAPTRIAFPNTVRAIGVDFTFTLQRRTAYKSELQHAVVPNDPRFVLPDIPWGNAVLPMENADDCGGVMYDDILKLVLAQLRDLGLSQEGWTKQSLYQRVHAHFADLLARGWTQTETARISQATGVVPGAPRFIRTLQAMSPKVETWILTAWYLDSMQFLCRAGDIPVTANRIFHSGCFPVVDGVRQDKNKAPTHIAAATYFGVGIEEMALIDDNPAVLVAYFEAGGRFAVGIFNPLKTLEDYRPVFEIAARNNATIILIPDYDGFDFVTARE